MSWPNLPKRVPLGFLPTPLHRLSRLSAGLEEAEIWIKRDDQTGLALGGNKTRKLEFLMAEALDENCDCVITAGAAQSNHCRQTAAAAAAIGLSCHLVLGGEPGTPMDGNLLLDVLLGATIHWSGAQRKGEVIPALAESLRNQGQRPFIIPYGGSNATGAMGFVHAMTELAEQEKAAGLCFDAIVFASSSGGTHAGLLVGKELERSRASLIGIRIDKEDVADAPFPTHIVDLANEVAERLGCARTFQSDELVLHDEYTGRGYGCVGALEREAIALLGRTEGILLDPVYTARAFGGMLDLLKRGAIKGGRILYWHTGGAPALFPYAGALTEANNGQ